MTGAALRTVELVPILDADGKGPVSIDHLTPDVPPRYAMLCGVTLAREAVRDW